MLRALSRRGYERLGEESSSMLLREGELKRSRTVPTWLHNPPSRNQLGGGGGGSVPSILEELPRQKSSARKKTNSKFSHPIFSLFEGKGRSRKKKATAKPEFSRYLDYLKEGGMWDPSSNLPVIYFK